jgi:hypothetical protein
MSETGQTGRACRAKLSGDLCQPGSRHDGRRGSLAIAAGIVFHQAHPGAASSVSRQDYEGALDLAAAALSRLIPVYVMRDPPGERATLMVDLTHARFARGAIELRVRGETVGELSVARSDLLSAVSLIKRTGLPFSFGGPTRL